MILYFVLLLDITISNATVPSGWNRATVVPIYKARDRWVVTNYRPVSLTSAVCKQTEPQQVTLGKSRIRINGYMKANTDLDRDTRVKAK